MKALDSNDELTPLGHILARLPIEPRLGRMLVFSCAFRLGGAMALIAAHSSFGCDVLAMPPDRRRLSWEQIRFAATTNSDHLAMLNAFQVWSTKRAQGGDQAANYFCDVRELNAFSLRIIDEAANQVSTFSACYFSSLLSRDVLNSEVFCAMLSNWRLSFLQFFGPLHNLRCLTCQYEVSYFLMDCCRFLINAFSQ